MPVGCYTEKISYMKKVLLAVAALMIAGASFGQTKFGVVAGAQFSSYTLKLGDEKSTSDLLVGLRAGFTADLQLADEFYIGTGLLYSGKGGKVKGTDDAKVKLGYLQVPINFLFKPEVGAGKLNLGAGPYVAYAVSGKYKVGDTSTDIFGDDVTSDDGAAYKRFDAGLGIVAGYELPVGLYLGIHADLGLINTLKKPDLPGDYSSKNTSFGVNVGYKF
jgi:hypothetical protein